MRTVFLLMLAICLLFSPLSPVKAKSKGKKKGKQANEIVSTDADAQVVEDEIALIRTYLGKDGDGKQKKNKKGGKQKSLPPGLQKKLDRGWDLPPGWQKKVARGEVLPQNLYEESEMLPEKIVRQLPRQSDDVETVILESKVIRILKKTREIVEILDL